MDSPYNTYRYPGLPPGPIASPGREAILAVLQPAAVRDLYFVSRNDGSHVFSETLVAHNQAVNQFQRNPAARLSSPAPDPLASPAPNPLAIPPALLSSPAAPGASPPAPRRLRRPRPRPRGRRPAKWRVAPRNRTGGRRFRSGLLRSTRSWSGSFSSPC